MCSSNFAFINEKNKQTGKTQQQMHLLHEL